MARTWFMPAPPSGRTLDLDAVSLLLDAPKDGAPGRTMLGFVNRVAPVEYITLAEYADDAPTLLEGHARGPALRNVTADCWALYRRHFFGFDEATRLARHARGERSAAAPLVALHYGVGDIPLADWRRTIYEREHLTDRLSFVYAPAPGRACAINLYRDEPMGRFGEQEIEGLVAVAPLLRQVHVLALGAHRTADRPARVRAAEQSLQVRAPALSPRERQVCARIACGLSADGIAADLDIAPSTVLTLRKRAYAKLDIHGRLELIRLAA